MVKLSVKKVKLTFLENIVVIIVKYIHILKITIIKNIEFNCKH